MQPAHIDLWLKKLSPSDAEYQHYWQLLNPQEQSIALKFVREQHRRQYVCCHGLLRIILASYLTIEPTQLEFATTALGKPYLPKQTLHFNLSHSADRMLLAITWHTAIGVDIETWHDHIDYQSIASHCFAERERNYWQQQQDTQKTALFYQLWTRKESFIKAVGAGLSLNVAEVETAIPEARFLKLPTGYGSPEAWQLIDLTVEQNFSAALTVPNSQSWQYRWC